MGWRFKDIDLGNTNPSSKVWLIFFTATISKRKYWTSRYLKDQEKMKKGKAIL